MQVREHVLIITLKHERVIDAKREYDEAIKEAVQDGVSFGVIARTVGVTEAAVRGMSYRNGWYTAGSRHRGKPVSVHNDSTMTP